MAAVTKEQVFEAAEQLESEGLAVNNRSIISKVGGSHSTVGKYLNEWKEQKEFSQSLKSVEIPLALSEKLNLFGAEIWRDASKIAEVENVALREQVIRLQAQISEQRDEHVKDIAEIETKHAKSLEEIEAENAELAAKAADARDLLTAQRDAEEARANDLDEKLKKAREEIAALQSQVTSEANLKAMLTALVGEMKGGDK